MSDAYCDASDRENRMKRKIQKEKENQVNTENISKVYVVLKSSKNGISVYGVYVDRHSAYRDVKNVAVQMVVNGFEVPNMYEYGGDTYQVCECSLSH